MSDAVEKIGRATEEFAAQLLKISREFKPRGGSSFPKRVVDVLSSDVVVRSDLFWRHVVSLQAGEKGLACLDFGCGALPHQKMIKEAGYSYVGLDYEASIDPARLARLGSVLEKEVVQYDGLDIPFEDGLFSTVWSWSSLEHCVHPERSVAEIARVLRPGGLFVGSVPHMMPYHAESAINFTPYGFYLACERHDLEPVNLYPSLDGLTFWVKNLALAMGMVDRSVDIDQRLRNSQLITPFLNAFKEAGHRAALPLQLHAELCGEFGFVVRKK